MNIKSFLSIFLITIMLCGITVSVIPAADYKIRATPNSNENDEDYDGLVVFKNYVESASNGAISVELFIGTQLCSKGAECLQGIADGSIQFGLFYLIILSWATWFAAYILFKKGYKIKS